MERVFIVYGHIHAERFGRKAADYKTWDLHVELTIRSTKFPQRDYILKALEQHPDIFAMGEKMFGSGIRPTQNTISITGILIMSEEEYASYKGS
jgi:hypothetical protein